MRDNEVYSCALGDGPDTSILVIRLIGFQRDNACLDIELLHSKSPDKRLNPIATHFILINSIIKCA